MKRIQPNRRVLALLACVLLLTVALMSSASATGGQATPPTAGACDKGSDGQETHG